VRLDEGGFCLRRRAGGGGGAQRRRRACEEPPPRPPPPPATAAVQTADPRSPLSFPNKPQSPDPYPHHSQHQTNKQTIKHRQASGALKKLRQELEDGAGGAGAPEQREAALLAAAQLCRGAGRAAEPYALPLLPLVLDALADKAAPVRAAAAAALDALAGDSLCPAGAALAIPVLLAVLIDEARCKWQTREGALKVLARLAADAPAQVQARLPDVVPPVSTATMDPKPAVAQAAADAGAACFALVGNRDIAHLVADLLHCVSRADELGDVVAKLSAATFVQSVEAPALAIMVPLLVRALRDENQTPVKRKACVIIANMTKLVASPADVLDFVPKLAPGVEKLARAAADPELRDTAAAALTVLERAAAEAAEHHHEANAAALSAGDVRALLAESAAGACGAEAARAVDAETFDHVAALCAQLCAQRSLAFDEWREATVPYLCSFAALGEGGAEGVGRSLLSKCADRLSSGADAEDLGWSPEAEDDPTARELCSCRFSLAYGGKILLNGATLRLVQGRRYGLCGANGAGKSTLMRAIARGQLEGFPSPEELRTLYVEHDIQASLESLGVVDYVAQDPAIRALVPAPDEPEIERQLRAVGFDDDLLGKAITSLSGGWKMKLALARAVLLRADILLLDEVRFISPFFCGGRVLCASLFSRSRSQGRSPFFSSPRSTVNSPLSEKQTKNTNKHPSTANNQTNKQKQPTNHLDVANVAWLQNYLNTQPKVTAMVVSHDSGFLDAVCTDIIHYQQRQLRRYRGNLSAFVAAVPSARSYYELQACTLRFRFPRPGMLDGITTKEKPIVKLAGVSFAYDPKAAAPKMQLQDVDVAVRLSSRVAVLGANGAGKSTLIKIITGEHKATGGVVTRHPNLRLAYVAQHAFHHIEQHLDTTPLKYVWYRFGMGEDKEESAKVTRQVEEDDKKRMAEAFWMFDGHQRRLDKIVSRRKKKKGFEYEVAWQGLSSIKFNRWITREELVEKGYTKVVNEFDGKRAAAALGADSFELTRGNLEKHFSDFGLEPEFSVHSNIRGLSGGQKVKLVLAAAMISQPHIIVMDEPTNYLDREALGALSLALREFEGGVVLISHNDEFVSSCTDEVWRVDKGRVSVEARAGRAQAVEAATALRAAAKAKA